jgi:fructose-bisphosphate aldolase class 1
MKSSGFSQQQIERMTTRPGFIAAFDQSGGSTPESSRDSERFATCSERSKDQQRKQVLGRIRKDKFPTPR